MRNFLFIGAMFGACAACTTPAGSPINPIDPVAQSAALPGSAAALNDPVVCRTIVGQTEVDGTPQRIVGNACRQPDGSWRIDSSEAVLYPADPAWAYADPWYYDPYLVWPAAVFGIGGSFVFFDHFHHFHHHDHPGYGGPWHGRSGMRTSMHGAGGMHGGGMFMNSGGGMRR